MNCRCVCSKTVRETNRYYRNVLDLILWRF
uniref:Uncharacterized protein n=1 Tax=Rhizophora mucronata TaxID=61149 RepID=A0A2P2QVI7_RHIMU